MKKSTKIGFVILLVFSGVTAFLILSTSNRKPFSETIRVACLGDSLTQSSVYTYELWKLLGSSGRYMIGNCSIGPDDYCDTLINCTRFDVGNFGAGSTTVLLNSETPYMKTDVFQSALEFQPNIVIIMLGTNDAQPNLEIYNASFVSDYMKLVAAVEGRLSKSKIWVVLPPPIFSNQSGKIDPEYFRLVLIPYIKQAANETNSPIIDVYSTLVNYPNYFPDGEHPNSEAAKIIAEEIYKAIIP
jgi:hypothetical protein